MPERNDFIDPSLLEEVAPKLRALVHPMRLRIIDVLKHGEQPVSKIAEAVERTQALTSHQLAILRNNGIIRARREGNRVYYSVVDKSAFGLLECIRQYHDLDAGSEVETNEADTGCR
jgi:ArsR family transcriptional regulator